MGVNYCMDCGYFGEVSEEWKYAGEEENGPLYLCPSCYWDATHDMFELEDASAL